MPSPVRLPLLDGTPGGAPAGQAPPT